MVEKMVRVVGAKDLHANASLSDEEFRLGSRRGLNLCNVINKVHPQTVSKVVESSCDSAVESSCDSVASPHKAALSAYKYFFYNARNFLVAVEQMGLHTFEASDLEQVSF
ncbi:putative minus-end-directed kinesin ATPase [Helianthus annuus]|nr:putative minus-end-directed kinesin ATPase [Helianthus annuus]